MTLYHVLLPILLSVSLSPHHLGVGSICRDHCGYVERVRKLFMVLQLFLSWEMAAAVVVKGVSQVCMYVSV